MNLIVLTGLAAIEKAELTTELADYFSQQGQYVMVLDNIARLPMSNVSVPVRRVEGDIVGQLPYLLAKVDSDVVLLAVSEQVHPDILFVTLDRLHRQFDTIDIQTLALIDLRTCDCFPHLREQLETYADAVVMLPYNLDEVLNDVRNF